MIKELGEKTKDYKYDSENHLISASVQQGNSVTVEDYTYDYAGNRTSKTVNELDVTRYINDINRRRPMIMRYPIHMIRTET